jgi:putative membrane protein
MALPPFHLHPEVVALCVGAEGAYLWAVRSLGDRREPAPVAIAAGGAVPGAGEDRPVAEPLAAGRWHATSRQITWFTAGVVVLFLAVSWPVDDLGDRYLFSVHMVQHMLLGLIVPHLLLLGMPVWLLRTMLSPRPLNWVVRKITRPLVALILFNVTILWIHWPAVENLANRNEPFHFLTHAVILAAGLVMWFPVVAPLPAMPSLSYPGKMIYLFLQSIAPTVPASFLTFGSTPLYSFYTHVPRIWGMSVLTDQLVAGLLLKLGGGAILWGSIAVIFFKWYREEHDSDGWDALKWRDVEREIHSEMAKR